MKKTFILISAMVLAGLVINNQKVFSQELRRATGISSSEQLERQERITYLGQDEKSTQLMLSKHFSGESVSKSGNFTVDEGIRSLRISIQGSIRNDGSITITIYSPGDDLFKEMEIDNSADIHWSQVINIGDNVAKYIGEWTYEIETDEAEGMYNLSITTH
ncbi:MAG: hypothetical protein AMS27_07755 [Bacteroides sp. SM23_62_1]|nr:MAG: hypothetical protein AMS27_07755 [Bacteroides sp. SM23_62_1]